MLLYLWLGLKPQNAFKCRIILTRRLTLSSPNHSPRRYNDRPDNDHHQHGGTAVAAQDLLRQVHRHLRHHLLLVRVRRLVEYAIVNYNYWLEQKKKVKEAHGIKNNPTQNSNNKKPPEVRYDQVCKTRSVCYKLAFYRVHNMFHEINGIHGLIDRASYVSKP